MNTRRRLSAFLVCAVLGGLAVLGACADEFLTGASIVRMRLLGGKVIVDGDPDRAWVRPGDEGRVELKLAFPDREATDMRTDPTRDVRSMILSCTKADIGTDQAQCAEVLFLFQLAELYRNGQLGADAGMPDGGAPPLEISQEDIDATFAALERGVGCDDRGEIVGEVDDPNDNIPDDDIPNYFGNASAGIRLVPLTAQPASLSCVDRLPTTAFSLASDYTDGDRLVQGVICEYGEPVFQLEAPFFSCRYEVGSDPRLPNRKPIAEIFQLTIGVERDGATNLHPRFDDAPFAIADDNESVVTPVFQQWNTPTAVLPIDCAGASTRDDVIVKDFEDKSLVRVTLEAMRELRSTDPDVRENYQVEAFSTFGELDRQFSVFDDLDTTPVIELEWEHGKRPRRNGELAGGKRVDFHFLIRDGRGGFAYETRTLCLCAGTCPAAPATPAQ